MRISNISVTQKNSYIKIKFTVIHAAESRNDSLYLFSDSSWYKFVDYEFKSFLKEHGYPAALQFFIKRNWDGYYFKGYLEDLEKEQLCYCETIDYTFPGHPIWAFFMLYRISAECLWQLKFGLLTTNNKLQDEIEKLRVQSALSSKRFLMFTSMNPDDLLKCSIPLLSSSRSELVDKSNFFQKILSMLLTFHDVPYYQKSMGVISLFTYPDKESAETPVAKANSFLALVRYIIRDNNYPLNPIISFIHNRAKENLLLKAGFSLDETFAESFIKNVSFLLLTDGRMAMTSLSKNKTDSAYPLREKRDLVKETRRLLNALGLELAPDSDFNDKIVFTKNSSKMLKRFGLHLDSNYIKQLLFTRNQLGFFTACSSISSNSPTLLDVPQEMIESVIGQIPSSLNRLIDRRELNQSVEQMLEDETRRMPPKEEELTSGVLSIPLCIVS